MNRTELPAAVYAVAGAGELAYERLRQLPEAAARTLRTASESADQLRERVRGGDEELAAGLAVVRESARQSAATLAAQAATAQERAIAGYRSLVARGERVVNDALGVATGHAEAPPKIEVVVGDVERAGDGDDSAPADDVEAAGEPAASGKPAASTTGTQHNGDRGVGKSGSKTPGKRADS